MTTPKGKSRLTVDISTALHASLRKEAIHKGTTIRALVTRAITKPAPKLSWVERFKGFKGWLI